MVDLAELLHRHVLLGARRTSSTWRGRRGSPGSAGPSPGLAWLSTTSSKVRFMSSIIASRLPPRSGSTPATGRGVLSSSSIPIDWASRRAGSIVSTTTLRPSLGGPQGQRGRGRGLADAARAAADDDPGARVVEQRVDVERGRRPVRARPSGPTRVRGLVIRPSPRPGAWRPARRGSPGRRPAPAGAARRWGPPAS